MRIYIVACLFLLIGLSGWEKVYPNHMMGGEVSYRCLGGNQFRITIVLYTDCVDPANASPIAFDNPANFSIFRNDAAKTLVFADSVFSSSSGVVPPEFSNECISSFPDVCLNRAVFSFVVNLAPDPFGYIIAYQRCCRNFALNNVVAPGTTGVTYFTTIPPFEAGQCPNNSPVFSHEPPQIICANNPFTYDYSATDSDGDSLAYRLAPSFNDAGFAVAKPFGNDMSKPPYNPVAYTFGLGFDNPMPSSPALVINAETGLMTAFPTSVGRYQVCVAVDEYRDGTLINTHYRDYQFLVTDCSKNVIADIPSKTNDPDIYIYNCNSFTVEFDNNSTGGFQYVWDFGDGSPESSDPEPTHTYADTGTYTVKLVVNRGTTCADSITKLVKIYPYFTADFGFSGILCPDEVITFIDTVHSTQPLPYTLSWNFGDGSTATGSNPTHTYDSGGIYKVTMHAVSESGCEALVEKEIDIRQLEPDAGNDTIIVLGYEFHLNASGGDYYRWSPATYLSDPNIADPRVNFPDTGYYTFVVEVTADEGCASADTVNVLVVKEPSVLMPNAFSPNGDGLNDVFRPRIVGYPWINYFRIYDRWGQEVFVSYTHHNGWDGTYAGKKKAESGVYWYEISVRDLSGNSFTQKGDLTLIR